MQCIVLSIPYPQEIRVYTSGYITSNSHRTWTQYAFSDATPFERFAESCEEEVPVHHKTWVMILENSKWRPELLHTGQ